MVVDIRGDEPVNDPFLIKVTAILLGKLRLKSDPILDKISFICYVSVELHDSFIFVSREIKINKIRALGKSKVFFIQL